MIKVEYDKRYRKGRLICDKSILDLIRNRFSVKNVNAKHIEKQLRLKGINKKIPERRYAVQESGMFDLGLYSEILDFLRDEQYTNIEVSDKITDWHIADTSKMVALENLSLELRDYQMECVETCLSNGWGTVVSATGSGKSLVQASLLECWKPSKCLIILPGTTLVHQLANDFETYGVSFEYSIWTGDNKLQDTAVVIVNRENLMAKFSKNDWIRNVDLVLMDECHGGKSDNKITKILSKISTRHKFGFTGTLPKDKIDYWKIIGMFGPVVYEKKSKELRDEKYLSNVEVKMICLTGHPFMKISYNAEREYLQSHGGRNNIIAKICDKLKKNVLVLVDRIEYGELLHQMINNGAKDRMVYFVHGEMPVEERREIIAQMEERNDVICVAMSSIFSTGINIKNLHYIVFTFAGKSFIRTIQSIGRGLRLHGDKRKLVLFDIFDNTKFSNLHSKKRKEFYDEEEIPWKETRVGI